MIVIIRKKKDFYWKLGTDEWVEWTQKQQQMVTIGLHAFRLAIGKFTTKNGWEIPKTFGVAQNWEEEKKYENNKKKKQIKWT